MLNRLGISPVAMQQCSDVPRIEAHVNRCNRNEKDDLKTAIDALYEFKRKLDELHPTCTEVIENMLQRPRY